MLKLFAALFSRCNIKMEVSIEAVVLSIVLSIVKIRSQLLVWSMKQPGKLQQSKTARQGLLAYEICSGKRTIHECQKSMIW